MFRFYTASARWSAASCFFFSLPTLRHVFLNDYAEKKQMLLCRASADELFAALGKAQLLLKSGARLRGVADFATHRDAESAPPNELFTLFREVELPDAPVLEFQVLDERGIVIGGSGGLGADKSRSSYFARAVRGRSYIAAPHIPPSTGRQALRLAEPVLRGGVPCGALVLTIDLTKIVGKWQQRAAETQQSVFLMDAVGRILIHSNMVRIGASAESFPFLPNPREEESGAREFAGRGSTGLLSFISMSGTGTDWTMVVEGNEDALLAGAAPLRALEGLLWISALLFALLPCRVVVSASARFGNLSERKRHALLLGAVEDGVIGLDTDGAIISMNPAAERTAHAEAGQLEGRPIHEVFRFVDAGGGDADGENCPLGRHVARAERGHFHGRLLRRADGSTFVGDMTLVPLREKGAPAAFLLLVRDVTETRDLEERMRAVYQATDKVFMEWGEDLRPMDCTEECARFFGADDKRELLSAFLYRYAPARLPDGSADGETLPAFVKQAFTGGLRRFTRTLRTRDGLPLPCEITLMPLSKGGRPAVLAHMRGLAPECGEYGNLPRLLQNVLDALPLPAGLETNGRWRLAGAALRRALGARPDSPVPFPRPKNSLDSAGGATRRIGLTRADGTRGEFLCACGPLHWAGEQGTLVVLADISDCKRVEQELIAARDAAEASAKARGDFLAVMSHEVRSPLNGIMGLLQLAVLEEENADVRGYLDTALALSHSLLQILSEILDFSKMESDCPVLADESFSPENILHTTLASFQSTAAEKNIELSCGRDPALPEQLRGDAGRIHQLLFNLVGNAVKYTPEGRIDVNVLRLPPHGENGIRVLFVVADSGLGVPPDELRRIFHPFSRGEAGYVRRQTGVGLGLSIVRRLVQLMGGSLCLFSGEGEGTEAHLILPLAPASEEKPAAPGVCLAEESAVRRDEDGRVRQAEAARVLVVDDDRVNRMAVKLMLGTLGLPADEAEGGARALRMLEERDYALVLLDIQMPDMDGFETLRRIRASARTASLPVAALTALAMRGDRERILEAGFDDYLSKPILLEKLDELRRRLLPKQS